MPPVDSEARYLSLEIPRKIALAIVFLLLFIIPALSYAAQGRGINTPDYWIGKLENPDEVVLAPEEIRAFNLLTRESMDQMADLASMPDVVSGERIFAWLWLDLLRHPGARYDSRGREHPAGFFEELAWSMGFDRMEKEMGVRFGAVVERADMRGLPTDEALLSRPGGFDSIQYSSVYPGEQVALLHTSRDGQWGFFQARALRGWIRMDRAAFGGREDLLPEGEDPLVITGSRVSVYGDKALKKPAAEVAMGGVLRLLASGKGGSPWVVSLPVRGKDGKLEWKDGYIRAGADVRRGYLPYTRRNMIRQAFKMLGEEYGWGGRQGLRDCSIFMQDLYATAGLVLPRNSRQQGVTGDIKAHLDEYGTTEGVELALKGSDPGITLLTLRGHVMLHIGDIRGRPYVIHQIFGYADGLGMKRIGKVAVTGLELGSRSPAGPMNKRLRGVTRITIPGRHKAGFDVDKNA